jgi:hypothetical protein
MRRDPDLQRQILLFIEEHCPPEGGLDRPIEIIDFDNPTVTAHLELLVEDGLVDGTVIDGVSPAMKEIFGSEANVRRSRCDRGGQEQHDVEQGEEGRRRQRSPSHIPICC